MDPCRIWKDVDALAFHENNIIFELLGRPQGTIPSKFSSSRIPITIVDHSGSLEWVTHPLDDFALVAAGTGGASNIALACLELNQIPGNYFITIELQGNLVQGFRRLKSTPAFPLTSSSSGLPSSPPIVQA